MKIRALRKRWGFVQTYKMADTCAAEFEQKLSAFTNLQEVWFSQKLCREVSRLTLLRSESLQPSRTDGGLKTRLRVLRPLR